MSISSIDRYIRTATVHSKRLFADSITPKQVLSRSPRMEIVFTESSKYLESDALERQNGDSGERSLMNMFIKEKRENEKDEEDMRQEEDNGRGNGKWHDAVRSEGSYTSLFPLFELIIPAR